MEEHAIKLQKTLAKFAAYFVGEAWEQRRAQKGKTTGGFLKGMVKGATEMGVEATSWRMQLNMMCGHIRKHLDTMYGRRLHRFIMQDRGWRPYRTFAQSSFLLLAAALPITKRIIKMRLITDNVSKAWIICHCAAELVLATLSLIVCSVAPAAASLGNTFLVLIKEAVAELLHWQPDIDSLVGQLDPQHRSQLLHTGDKMKGKLREVLFEFSSVLLEEIREAGLAMGLERPLLARVFLGMVAFWILFAAISRAMMPLKVVLPLSVCLNAAVCGPFYLVAEVEEVHVKKASQRVIALIFIRALFFCVLVGCACWNVSALGARLFFALPLNRVERPPWLEIWALIYFIYLASGFFAQLAIEKQCQLNRAKEKASAVQHPQERQSLRRRQSESGRLYPMPPPPPPRKSQLSIKSKVSEITKV